jgi:aryl-alcohol dehydrogenase-like predicted oxidoreductase
MTELNAALAEEFTFGSDLAVNRLGFGAMRLTGPGVWGEPRTGADFVWSLAVA